VEPLPKAGCDSAGKEVFAKFGQGLGAVLIKLCEQIIDLLDGHAEKESRSLGEYQLNVLPKSGFRCITLDLRGFGNSDAPWSGYDYDRLADDILAVVKSLRLKDFTLTGKHFVIERPAVDQQNGGFTLWVKIINSYFDACLSSDIIQNNPSLDSF
jgi:hypothetical protein